MEIINPKQKSTEAVEPKICNTDKLGPPTTCYDGGGGVPGCPYFVDCSTQCTGDCHNLGG